MAIKKSGTPKGKLRQRLTNKIPQGMKVSKERMQNLAFVVPNLVTVIALCMGLSAVRFAIQGRWEFALSAILLAGLLDAMDGRIARYLNTASRFGAELDSLADFINFGVSPALMIYLKSMNQWQGYGWIFCLYFAVCLALRLARFNTLSIEGSDPKWSSPRFFMGTPAPACALLVLTPTMLDIDFAEATIWATPIINAIALFLVGSLAVSTIPTFSFKKTHVEKKYVVPILVGMTLTLGALFTEPWITLSVIMGAYLLTIPYSIRAFKKQQTIRK